MRPCVLLLIISSCATTSTPRREFIMQQFTSGVTASLRGISVVNERIVWASGTGGTVLRTTDGGVSWQNRKVTGADSLDFRDIEAFDSLTAYVLSAGETGRIYHTRDGGVTWLLRHSNQVKGAFFDCFDFYDRRNGIALSDPIDGRYLLLRTTDGVTWTELPVSSRPLAGAGEAAFAASGTCLTIAGSNAYIGSGGGATARVFVSADGGLNWKATTTPVAAGQPSAGIFALAFRDQNHGIAVGGDYLKAQQEATVAVTSDGGRSWKTAGQTSYTSGAAWSRSGSSLLAVGTPGTRASYDQAGSWQLIDAVEYNAVQFAGEDIAFAVGPRGRVAKLGKR